MEEAEVLLEHLHETSTRSRATYSRHLDFIGGPEHCDPRRPRGDSLDFSPNDVNEAMMNQIEASDQWSYYQAKSIKASVLDAKMPLVGTPNESDQSKRDRYEKEQEEIKSEAEHKEAAAKSNFHKHEMFAGVTMFQIAIAVAAISVLTKRRRLWIVSLLFGAAGCAFLVLAAIIK